MRTNFESRSKYQEELIFKMRSRLDKSTLNEVGSSGQRHSMGQWLLLTPEEQGPSVSCSTTSSMCQLTSSTHDPLPPQSAVSGQTLEDFDTWLTRPIPGVARRERVFPSAGVQCGGTVGSLKTRGTTYSTFCDVSGRPITITAILQDSFLHFTDELRRLAELQVQS